MPTPSLDSAALSAADRGTLLEAAQRSVASGIAGTRLAVRADEYSHALRAWRASFVTLHVLDELRGCIGSLEANRPLVEDVVDNAYAAAFHDPRFPGLVRAELAQLSVHISILSPLERLRFESEQELIALLRPGIDGLLLTERHHRGTFLPAVWRQLPEPHDFLQRLKEKAGLPPHYWSDTVTVERYTTESVY